MMKYKASWFPAILAGLAWIAAIFCYIILLITMPRQPWLWGLSLFLPALFLTVTALLSEQHIFREPLTICSTVLISIAGVIGALCLLVFLCIDAAVNPVTDPGQYKRILGICGHPERESVSAFPSEIPESASDVRFSYHFPLLQGGEELSLQFTLPEEQADQLKAGIESLPDFPAPEYLTKFEFDDAEDGKVWYSHSYKPSDWNHGELGAVFWKGNTFFYYMEDW